MPEGGGIAVYDGEARAAFHDGARCTFLYRPAVPGFREFQVALLDAAGKRLGGESIGVYAFPDK